MEKRSLWEQDGGTCNIYLKLSGSRKEKG